MDALGIFSGIIGLLILIFGIMLAVAWLILPFIIHSKLSAIQKHLARIALNAGTQRRYTMAALNSIITNTAIAGEALQGARIEAPPKPPA
jgi:hypothetical protein